MTQKEMIETIAQMNNERQNSFYNRLRENGMSEDEIRTIQAVVFYYKLYNDPALYNAVRDEMGRQLYKEFTK